MSTRGGDRALSSVVAVTILFGFLVIGLSIYQGVVIPSHNKRVEYNHDQGVQRDLLQVRDALLETKVTGQDGYVTVDLGMRYPARIFALNPPPVTGTIRTTAPRPILISNATGGDVSTTVCPGTPETRFLEYGADYHEYQNAPTVVYENSVVYKQFSTGNVTMSGQTFVQGNTINVIPLQATYSETSTGAVSLEPKAGLLKTTTVESPTVVLPTKLGQQDWRRLLAGQVDPQNVTVSDGNLTVDFQGKYTMQCGPVAVNQVPPSGGRNAGGVDINPVAPGDVQLMNAKLVGNKTNSNNLSFDLNNTAANDTTVERARISFFFNGGGKGTTSPTYADIYNATDSPPTPTRLNITGETKVLKKKIVLHNQTRTTVRLDFDQSVSTADFVVLKLTLQSGQTGTYFIAPR